MLTAEKFNILKTKATKLISKRKHYRVMSSKIMVLMLRKTQL